MKTATKAKETTKATAKSETQPTKAKNVILSKTPINAIINPTPEDKIQRAENFAILAKRHNFLKTKKEELDRFIISSDGTKEKIILQNADGFAFEVSNTQVIEKVVDVVQNELATFINHSSNEILNYSI